MALTIIDSLKKAGLTRLEAEVYLFLVQNPQASESYLCNSLNVSLSDIKTTIASLLQKGLVKILDSEKYDAIPPSKAAQILLEVKTRSVEAELAELRKQLQAMKSDLEDRYWEKRYGIRDELLIEPLDDLRSMEVKTAEIISRAQRDISIFTASFEWYPKVRELLLNALYRKVAVRVLMRAADERSKRIAKDLAENGADVRYATEDWYPVRGTLVDESKLVFLIWTTEKKLSYYKPHYTENPGLIKVFNDAFNRRWERAKPVTL
jgi:sugar-specific transcriptional regulator TrmB